MKHVITLCRAPSTDIEILQEVSAYCPSDKVFIIPNGTTLENCVSAKDYKDLQKRYAYLEKARTWILKNIRGGK
jgi:hypothetical protein